MELLIDNVINIGADEFCRTSRYKLPLVVILVNSSDKKAFDILEENTRQLDIVQQLESELIVVFLTHTDSQSGISFINKIKRSFEFTYTMKEFIEDESIFVEALFLENLKKLK